jgi:di/tricarboxylate transporter
MVFGIEGLTLDILMLFAIITLTVLMFVLELVRVDVSAWVALVLLGITKLVPAQQLFSGFSSDAVVSIIGIMIMVAGLERSGMIQKLAQFLIRIGQDKQERLRVLLMLAGGALAGFMRSEGAVSLLLPVVTRISKRSGISKKRFLIPLAFCSILGGTLTMVGTGPLVLLNNLLSNANGLRDVNGHPLEVFSLFFIFPVGLSLLLLGALYFYFFSKWLFIPVPQQAAIQRSTLEYFHKVYELGSELLEVEILASSPWVGLTVQKLEERLAYSVVILALKNGQNVDCPPLRKEALGAGARLALLANKKDVQALEDQEQIILRPGLEAFAELLHPSQSGPCEAVIPPSSQWVGREMRELHMRREHNVQIMAVHRGSKVLRGQEMMEITLRPGDTLGMFSRWHILQQLEQQPDLVILTPDYPRENPYTHREWSALSFFALSIVLILSGIVSLPVALMVGAVGMVFAGILNIDEAYNAVSWKIVFLLAGILPLGLSMQSSGAAALLSQQLLMVMSSWSLWHIEIMIAVLATLLGLVLSNVGATVLLVPVVVELAKQVGGDPRAFALIAALAASNLFIIPTHPANTLVMGPGHYGTRDFLRAGSIISILYIIVVVLLVPRLV